MFRVLYLLVFVLCSTFVNAEITEIMYNPPGSDNNKEYVEIIFTEETLIDGWTVEDSASQDIILLINGSGNSKINLIVEEGYSADYFEGIDLEVVSVYSAGKTIGGGLSNTEDIVVLYNLNMDLVDSRSYDGLIGNGDGNAICYDNEEYSCLPSPGEINDGPSNESGGNETSEDNETKEVIDEVLNEESGYIHIEGVDNNSPDICGNIKVRVALWNNRDKTEKIKAYLMGVDIVSSFRIEAHEGQVVEFPVAVCNNSAYPKEGEYVLVVEGLREKDMRVLWIEGQKVLEKEDRTLLKGGTIERDINAVNEVNPDARVAVKEREWWDGIVFYLIYLIGGLGVYYVLFRM
ncbi:hypothetical protein HOF78_02565 [Candidatus Woesearchaeota archaeon]|jgi:hypothetical protein|nr:hypothetical protein [Candidatus Woesearchaeota archaeon]MBT6044924.1 hypothetical protein [Candidatus Woesearchaeota archaeon]